MSFEYASHQWDAGLRRLRDAPPERQVTLERVTGAIVDELRRRLGSSFTTAELAELYVREGTDWCSSVAASLAPEQPWAWDAGVVADAAFAHYMRDATDYAGGKRSRSARRSA